MRTSEQIGAVAKAVHTARAEMKAVGKSGTNNFDKYNYAKLEDYINAIEDILTKHGLILISSEADVLRLPDRPTKSGSIEHAVQTHLIGRIIHTSGEWLEIDMHGEGADRADKALYKSNTGSRKYLIANILNLATTDDPENDETAGRETQARKPAAVAKPAAAGPIKPLPASAKTLDERINNCIKLFSTIEVGEIELVEMVGTTPDEWTEKDLANLNKSFREMKSNRQTETAGA